MSLLAGLKMDLRELVGRDDAVRVLVVSKIRRFVYEVTFESWLASCWCIFGTT